MQIKKIISFIFVLLFSFVSVCINNVNVNAIDTSAQSAIIMCADSTDTVYSKNENMRLPMASTTKIMTALLTLEEADANNKIVTITNKMVPVEGSSMGLHLNDKLSLYSLAQGMLTVSGNDAATSAAIAISGSCEEFSKKMNNKAKQIGMKNTNFVTPSGLDDENHYSTAYDMALLASYAMENDKFSEITSKVKMDIKFEQPKKTQTYYNSNKLLRKYKGCIGVKTGFTKTSGRCLVTCAERNGSRLVCVTLNDGNDWQDHINMYNYAFEHVKNIEINDSNLELTEEVVGGDQNSVNVKGMFPINVTVKDENVNNITKKIELPNFVYAPVVNGQILGRVNYINNGKVIASVNLIAQNDVNKYDNKWIKFKNWFIDLFN